AHDLSTASGDASDNAMLVALGKAISIVPDDSVQTSNNPGALIFAVRVSWPDAEKAAGVANELVSRLIEANVSRRSKQARLATDFLRRDSERAEQALHDQSAQISAFKEQYRGELPSELPTKMARLERLQAQRAALGTQISEAEGRVLMLDTQG